MRVIALLMVLMMGCTSGTDFGVYTEFFGPDRIVDQSIDLTGVDLLLEINTKVKCINEDPVSICVESTSRQWCAAAACIPGQYVNAVFNPTDSDMPVRPTRAYVSGNIGACVGIWVVAVQ